MKNRFIKLFLIIFITIFTLSFTACSGGGGNAAGIDGAALGAGGGGAKGPFKLGSTVTAYQLVDGVRDSSKTTLTTDDKGNFNFGTSIPWSGATEFIIYGEYLNENTGTYMNLSVSNALRAVVSISTTTTEDININIFTNIAAPGIIKDLKNSVSIAQAKATAQANIKKLFNLELPAGVELSDLDLTDSTKNQKDNTQLLLISAALLNTANPEQVMQDLASDMEDGIVDDGALGALEELKIEAAKVDLEEVAAKMKEANIGVNTLDVASVLDGTLAFNHTINFTNLNDAYRSTLYTSNEVTVSNIIGTKAANISVTNGEFSIDGAAFTSTASTITNGQKLRVRTTSASAYVTDKTLNLTIGGGLIPYTITTKSDPTVDDSTPNKFTFGYKKDVKKDFTITSDPVTITGITVGTLIFIVNGEFKINNGSFTNVSATISNDDNVTLRHTASASNGEQVKSILTIGGVSGSFSSFTLPADTTPDQFTFISVNDKGIDTLTTSNTITIAGINTATPISIDGIEINTITSVSIIDGVFSINGGAFGTTTTTISNGDTLALRLTSSSDFQSVKSTSITVGNVVSTFNVTTLSNPMIVDATPNAFNFTSKFAQDINIDIDSNTIVVSGINTDTSISIVNGTYSINDGTFTSNDANISNGDDVKLRHNISTYETQETATLTIGGISATFSAKTKLEDKTPNLFSFDTQTDVVANTELTSNTITVSGLSVGTTLPISVVNGEFEINSDGFTSTAAEVTNGDTIKVKQTSSATQSTANVATLTIGSIVRSFTTLTAKNPPAINGAPASTTAEDALFEFKATIASTSGAIALWSIENKPTWATFNTINGLLSGTPTNDDVGETQEIIITATNEKGNSSLEAFNLTVTNTNDAPVANDFTTTVLEDNIRDVVLLKLISDMDIGDTISSLTITTEPTDGSVSLINGTALYTPNLNYFGTDSFVYTVADGASVTDTGTVTINITSDYDAPIAVNDATSTPEEQTVAVDVAANDTDVDSATLTVKSISTPPTNGTATFSGGVITYTPALNFVGTDSLTYTITDSFLDSSATLTIEVTNVNDAPIAGIMIVPVDTPEDAEFSFDALATDADNDDLTFSLVNNPTWMSITGNRVSGTPTNDDVGINQNIQVFVTDGIIASPILVKAFNLKVINTNDAPTAQDASIDVVMNGDYSGILISNDVDVGDTKNFTSVDISNLNGTLSIDSSTGAYTYLPVTDFEGDASFTFKVTDSGNADSNIATISIVVADRVINYTAVGDIAATDEDSNITIDVLANDISKYADDNTDASGTTIIGIVYDGNSGAVSIVDNKILYVPNENFNGEDVFTYTAISQSGIKGTTNVKVIVNSIDDATVWNTSNSLDAVNEDFSEFTATLSATDIDGEVTYSLVSTQGIISASVTGSTLTITPIANLNGTESIVVKATQGGIDSTHTISLEVTPVNDAPTLTLAAPISVTTDSAIAIAYSVSDIDTNASNISVNVSSTTGLAEVTSDSVITYTPPSGVDSVSTITITANDGEFAIQNSTTVIVTIDPTAMAGGINEGDVFYEIDEDGELVAHKSTFASGNIVEESFSSNPTTGEFNVPYSFEEDGYILTSSGWTSWNIYDNDLTYNIINGNVLFSDGGYVRIKRTLNLYNPSTQEEFDERYKINQLIPNDTNITFTSGARGYLFEYKDNFEQYQLLGAVGYDNGVTNFSSFSSFSNFFDFYIPIAAYYDNDQWVGVDLKRNSSGKVLANDGGLFSNTLGQTGPLVVYNDDNSSARNDVNETIGYWEVIEINQVNSVIYKIDAVDTNVSSNFILAHNTILTLFDNNNSGDIVWFGIHSPINTKFMEEFEISEEGGYKPTFNYNTEAFTNIEDNLEDYYSRIDQTIITKALFSGQTFWSPIDGSVPEGNNIGFEKSVFNADATSVTWTEIIGGNETGILGVSIDGNIVTVTDGNDSGSFTVIDILTEYIVVQMNYDGAPVERLYLDEDAARAYFLGEDYAELTNATKALLAGKIFWYAMEGSIVNEDNIGLAKLIINENATSFTWMGVAAFIGTIRGDIIVDGDMFTIDKGGHKNTYTLLDTSNLPEYFTAKENITNAPELRFYLNEDAARLSFLGADHVAQTNETKELLAGKTFWSALDGTIAEGDNEGLEKAVFNADATSVTWTAIVGDVEVLTEDVIIDMNRFTISENNNKETFEILNSDSSEYIIIKESIHTAPQERLYFNENTARNDLGLEPVSNSLSLGFDQLVLHNSTTWEWNWLIDDGSQTWTTVEDTDENESVAVQGDNTISIANNDYTMKYLGTISNTQFNSEFGTNLSENATIHKTAYLANVEDYDYFDDSDSWSTDHSTLENFISNYIDGSIIRSIGSYVLTFDDNYNGTDTNGLLQLKEHTQYSRTLVNSNAGTWEIVTIDGNRVLKIKPYNNGDHTSYILYVERNGLIYQGEWTPVNYGAYEYFLDLTAKNEVIADYLAGNISEINVLYNDFLDFSTEFDTLNQLDPTPFMNAGVLYEPEVGIGMSPIN